MSAEACRNMKTLSTTMRMLDTKKVSHDQTFHSSKGDLSLDGGWTARPHSIANHRDTWLGVWGFWGSHPLMFFMKYKHSLSRDPSIKEPTSRSHTKEWHSQKRSLTGHRHCLRRVLQLSGLRLSQTHKQWLKSQVSRNVDKPNTRGWGQSEKASSWHPVKKFCFALDLSGTYLCMPILQDAESCTTSSCDVQVLPLASPQNLLVHN